MIEPLHSKNVWIEKEDRNVESFVGFAKFFSYKTVTTLKSTALVDYFVCAISLNVLARRTNWFKRNGYTLVRLLPVYCNDEHLEGEGNREEDQMSVYGFTYSMIVSLESAVHIPA